MRITVFGDIMCEPPVLKGAKTPSGEYDFHYVFENMKPVTEKSDFIIGNLEFPMAGEDAKYTDTYYIFNAPDSYAQAAKDAGFDVISVVNNHTLDRGFDGMCQTLKTLERIGLPYTGAFLPEKGHENAYYFEVGGVKFALIAYTYTTNAFLPKGDEREQYINYLRYPRNSTYLPEVRAKMNTWVDRRFPSLKEEHRCVIKKLVGLPPTIVRADDNLDEETIKPYVERFTADIRAAKEQADFVIFYPHVGGQFNREPGRMSKFVFEQALNAGADAILASHSHTIQRAYWDGKVPCAYCLGNFNMDGISPVVIRESLPGFGLAMHLDFEGKTLTQVSYTITKAIKKKGKLVTWPVADLYDRLKTTREKEKLEQEVRETYRIITGKELTGSVIRKEYVLES